MHARRPRPCGAECDHSKILRRGSPRFEFGDERFIIQRENGRSSSFCFPIVLNPACNPDRTRVFAALEDADIGYRIITGGSFPKHDAIRHFDFELVGGAVENANTAHDFGFFVGNHPFDLTPQIERVYDVLDKTCDGGGS